jgi:phosphonatase-like hydrolase
MEAALSVSRRHSLRQLAIAGTVPWSALAAHRKPQPAIRLVVLDVGGTIIEDRGDVPEALRSAMKRHGIRSSSEEIGRRRGASKREVIRYFVDHQSLPPDVDRDRLTAAIHDEFTANLIKVYRSVPPIAGASDAIRELRAGGYLLAATTGFDRTITTSIFQRLGWEGHFAAVICSDDVAQGRPAPFMIFHAMESARVSSVAQVVAVGDTPLDLQAGTNAGVRAVVGVLTGAATAQNLRKETHTHILSSVAHLPALLTSKL